MIRAALADARAELAALDARRSELQELISQGEAALGETHRPVAASAMTLHEALALILQAARALTAAGQTPFTRISIYQWIWRRYPQHEHERPSLDPILQGMTRNAVGGPSSACGKPLIRIDRGRYILA